MASSRGPGNDLVGHAPGRADLRFTYFCIFLEGQTVLLGLPSASAIALLMLLWGRKETGAATAPGFLLCRRPGGGPIVRGLGTELGRLPAVFRCGADIGKSSQVLPRMGVQPRRFSRLRSARFHTSGSSRRTEADGMMSGSVSAGKGRTVGRRLGSPLSGGHL